jgi:hypothetical protein
VYGVNCNYPEGLLIQGNCYCLGLAGYSGMPNIAFRLKNYMKYSFDPVDFLSTPLINITTNTPFCKLGVVNYWNTQGSISDLSQNVGFGSIFAVKYGFFLEARRSAD